MYEQHKIQFRHVDGLAECQPTVSKPDRVVAVWTVASRFRLLWLERGECERVFSPDKFCSVLCCVVFFRSQFVCAIFTVIVIAFCSVVFVLFWWFHKKMSTFLNFPIPMVSVAKIEYCSCILQFNYIFFVSNCIKRLIFVTISNISAAI